jgi:hypothetical protein
MGENGINTVVYRQKVWKGDNWQQGNTFRDDEISLYQISYLFLKLTQLTPLHE